MAELNIPASTTIGELQAAGAPGTSKLAQWARSIKGGASAVARTKQHAAAAGHGLRQGGESLLVGGALGALHVAKGLDIKKVPVDAAIGVVGLIAGAAMAHEEFGVDLRNAGATGLGIFAFRKTFALMAKKRKEAGKPVAGTFEGDDEGFVPHGDFGAEDPIVAAARFL